MKRELTCIVCPMGCSLTAELEGGRVVSVSGNTCPKGKAYAESECISPVRVITTTVKSTDGKIIPVKTDRPVPRDKIFDVMDLINKTRIRLPISAGDVIIKNVFGSNVVSVKNVGGETDE